jgi:serine phosphatase RsbU (regulator of sigma subunit)
MNHAINRHSLQRLVNTVQELSMARDITTVMAIVRKIARELTGADGATFVLRDRLSEGEFCFYADEDAIGPLWKGSRFPIEACISGHAMLDRKPIVIEDIYTDDRIPIAAYEVTFVKSLAMVPIRTIDPVGAIGNYWANQHLATEEEVSLLQSLADITAVTLENIKVYDELEQRVKERTLELEEKNQEILKSITYAKRIQQAILPPVHLIHENLIDSFVLYKPKDIVAGDFYWMERKDNLLFIAVGDCTGHGVPGAIVSVICSNALNRSVNEFGITETGKILDKARELVLETFAKSDEEIKDGMDISLCSIDTLTNTVCWSGANTNLIYIHKEQLMEIKAHKQPIGKSENPTPFPTHQLQLEKGDKIYLISDGFADQFGGEKGKKYKRNHLESFIQSIQHDSLEIQKNELERNFENWKRGVDQVDDVTIVGIGL